MVVIRLVDNNQLLVKVFGDANFAQALSQLGLGLGLGARARTHNCAA